MADIYVDTDGGSDVASGADWANALKTLSQAINTTAVAGDRIFIQGAADDAYALDLNLTAPGTISNPILIFGVSDGTTAEPPTTSDLVEYQAGDSDVPQITTTGGNDHIVFAGFAYSYGVNYLPAERPRFTESGDAAWSFENCRIGVGNGDPFEMGAESATEVSHRVELIDVDIAFGNASSHLNAREGVTFVWRGGAVIAASGVNILFDGTVGVNATIQGVDLTAMGSGKSVVDVSAAAAFSILIANCELPASLSLTTGTWQSYASRVKLHNCSVSTGISTSVIALEEATYLGTISAETARVRTGGATDGAAGAFSWAVLPRASAPQFPHAAIVTPPMAIWLDGTETTVTVHIANNAAGGNDLQDDEVWLEVVASDSTLDTAQFVSDRDRMALLGTPADQADDTGSTWGSGANNHQTLAVTIAPGYAGWAFCYVHCAERAASPRIVYVDPLPVLS